jgi:hypothetical protein
VWGGHTQAHCRTCHRHFSTVSAADLHLRDRFDDSPVIHLDPATIRWRGGAHAGEPKLVFDEQRQLWRHPGDRPRR